MQTDGSVKFIDSDGNEAGGIAAPWDFDADGEEVATSYAPDGDTLVQTVEHHDATYPVVADPFWAIAYVVVGRCMASVSCTNMVIAVISHGPVTARVVYNALSNGPTGRTPGHHRAVLLATNGQFYCPPLGRSHWPLTFRLLPNPLRPDARFDEQTDKSDTRRTAMHR